MEIYFLSYIEKFVLIWPGTCEFTNCDGLSIKGHDILKNIYFGDNVAGITSVTCCQSKNKVFT